MFGSTFTPSPSKIFMLPAHGLNAGIPASTTQYTPFFLYGLNSNPRNLVIPLYGAIYFLMVYLSTPQPTSGGIIVALTNNNVPTSTTFTIPANAPGNIYSTTIPYNFTPTTLLSVSMQNLATATSGAITAVTALAQVS